MFRLIGIGVLGWVLYAAFTYAIAVSPGPRNPAPETAAHRRPSPVEAIVEAGVITEGLSFADPGEPAFESGAYSIGRSSDPSIARLDRDRRPSSSHFITNGRTETEDESDDTAAERDEADERDADDDDDDDEIRVDTPGSTSEGRDPELVKGEISPGLYATTFETEGCSYELWRVMKDRETKVIGEDQLADGRLLVSINGIEPDWITSTAGCDNWYVWEPQPEPLTTVENGDYWIGDLAAGTWVVPEPCRWEKVVGFHGAKLRDVVDFGAGPGSLTIDADTLGVRIRDCKSPLSLTAAAADTFAP